MNIARATPLRGLMAGLLALIVFASLAVAMATGGSAPTTGLGSYATVTPSVDDATVQDARGDGGRFDGDGDGRGGRDGDGRGGR